MRVEVYTVDSRQVVSFFTGWVFFSSIHYLIFSTFCRYVASRVLIRALAWISDKRKNTASETAPPANVESQPVNIEKPFQRWASKLQDDIIFSDKEYPTLVFLTTLLFAMASLSQFGSLLRFSPGFSGAETACGKFSLYRYCHRIFNIVKLLWWRGAECLPNLHKFLAYWFWALSYVGLVSTCGKASYFGCFFSLP